MRYVNASFPSLFHLAYKPQYFVYLFDGQCPIEKAVRAYLEQMGEKLGHDIVDRSFGAWRREETAQETWSRAREAFNRSFERHKESSR